MWFGGDVRFIVGSFEQRQQNKAARCIANHLCSYSQWSAALGKVASSLSSEAEIEKYERAAEGRGFGSGIHDFIVCVNEGQVFGDGIDHAHNGGSGFLSRDPVGCQLDQRLEQINYAACALRVALVALPCSGTSSFRHHLKSAGHP